MTPQTVFYSSDGGEIVQGLTLTRLDSTQAMPSWIFAVPFGELQITRDWSSTTTVVERSECWDFFLRIDFVWGVSTRVLFGRATHTHTHTQLPAEVSGMRDTLLWIKFLPVEKGALLASVHRCACDPPPKRVVLPTER